MLPNIDRRSWLGVAIAALVCSLATSQASAQPTGADIRALLGGSVNLEQVAAFAATRTTYKQFCGGAPEEEVRANGINRLNYGSLEPEQQDEFKRIMHAQQVSNAELLTSLSPDGGTSFCQGLNRAVTTTVTAFVQAHPQLFETVELERPKPININGERFRYSAALMEGLYIGRLTVLEPKIQADIDRIKAESHDLQTFEWHLTRFPDLYEAMRWELNRLEVQLGHMEDPTGCYGPNIENWLQAAGCS